jgi:predicted Zn-dependent protease
MNTEALKELLNQGQDSLILRFGLGQALLNDGLPNEAIQHLQKALEFDPNHSAAYKLLGKAYTDNQQTDEAITTYEKGIQLSETKGDIQAAKEMKVHLKRLIKQEKTSTMSKEEAIAELRREAQELDDKQTSLSGAAGNIYKAKIRRAVADKLEKELQSEK